MKFRYTILYVEDVARSLEFYERAFGLETGFLHESGAYGELATGGTRLAFSSRALMTQLGKAPARAVSQAPSSRSRLRPTMSRARLQGPVPQGRIWCRT